MYIQNNTHMRSILDGCLLVVFGIQNLFSTHCTDALLVCTALAVMRARLVNWTFTNSAGGELVLSIWIEPCLFWSQSFILIQFSSTTFGGIASTILPCIRGNDCAKFLLTLLTNHRPVQRPTRPGDTCVSAATSAYDVTSGPGPPRPTSFLGAEARDSKGGATALARLLCPAIGRGAWRLRPRESAPARVAWMAPGGKVLSILSPAGPPDSHSRKHHERFWHQETTVYSPFMHIFSYTKYLHPVILLGELLNPGDTLDVVVCMFVFRNCRQSHFIFSGETKCVL